MANIHYFTNCRGADFFPCYASVWEKAGHINNINPPFKGLTSSMDSDQLIFNGATRISTWVHMNKSEVKAQVKYLKSAGVNLLRIHLDLYAWAAMGATFIDRIKYVARIAQDHKLYIQWVLFEGDTWDDISGISSNGIVHKNGGYDPTSLEQAMQEGLFRYQRCPTVYCSSLLTRTPSSMVVSGDSYFSDVISNLSGFRSTLSWEVMSNVGFNTSANPSDVSAYNFLASAINKAKALIPSTQKVTASFKYITGVTASEYYNSTQANLLSTLDFICYKGSNVSYIDRIVNYVDALSASRLASKPLLVVDATLPSHFNYLDQEIGSFHILNMGWVTDGIIDRTLGAKPLNCSRGIFYDDGTVRRQQDVDALQDRAIIDLNLHGRRRNLLNTTFTTKSDFEPSTLYFTNYDASTMTRLSQWGTQGSSNWSMIRSLYQLFPEYSGVSTKYAPFEADTRSSTNGWEVADGNLSLTTGGELSFILNSIAAYIAGPPLATMTDEVARDKKAYRSIQMLDRLQKGLPLTIRTNLSSTSYDPSFISYARQAALFATYTIFEPSSQFKPTNTAVTPYLGSARYFSAVNTVTGPYAEAASSYQKPPCYFNRGGIYASGSCLYLTGVAVDSVITNPQNVIAKLDWAAYDTALVNWVTQIFLAYTELVTPGSNFLTYLDTISRLQT